MSGGRWLTHENQTGRKTEIWKWLTYKNIGQRTCHIDGSGSSEDFSLLGVEESIDHSKIHFMLCHVLGISLEFLAGGGEALILFFGQWGQEFLILCCGNAAASAATHWQFHNSSSCTGAFLPKTCQSCFGHKHSWHCIKIILWWNFCICGSHIVASRIEFDDETGAITGTSRDSSTMRVVFTIVQPPETAFVSFLGQTFQRSCTRASWSSNQN